MIKAHVTSVSVHGALETASRTAGDTGTTVDITTSTATPIDTVIRVATAKAPTRPTHLPYPIVVSFPRPCPRLTPGTSLTASVQQPVCRSVACAKPKNFGNPDNVQQSIFVGKHRRIANLRFRQ
jgi:hypothetical protein